MSAKKAEPEEYAASIAAFHAAVAQLKESWRRLRYEIRHVFDSPWSNR